MREGLYNNKMTVEQTSEESQVAGHADTLKKKKKDIPDRGISKRQHPEAGSVRQIMFKTQQGDQGGSSSGSDEQW